VPYPLSTADITRRKVVPRRCTNHFQLLPCASARFVAASQGESLADSLGDRHAAGASHSLNFAVLVILKNYLQSIAHSYESIRLKAQTLSSLSFGSMSKARKSKLGVFSGLRLWRRTIHAGLWCEKRTVSDKKGKSIGGSGESGIRRPDGLCYMPNLADLEAARTQGAGA
jgi:hypothetical protein